MEDKLLDGIEVSKDGKEIYVGNYSAGQLIVVDSYTGKIKQKINTGKNLHGIDMSPDGKYLYLAIWRF